MMMTSMLFPIQFVCRYEHEIQFGWTVISQMACVSSLMAEKKGNESVWDKCLHVIITFQMFLWKSIFPGQILSPESSSSHVCKYHYLVIYK